MLVFQAEYNILMHPFHLDEQDLPDGEDDPDKSEHRLGIELVFILCKVFYNYLCSIYWFKETDNKLFLIMYFSSPYEHLNYLSFLVVLFFMLCTVL